MNNFNDFSLGNQASAMLNPSGLGASNLAMNQDMPAGFRNIYGFIGKFKL